jgi:O-methyltransferase involved in polyketide biosynthesis
LGNEVFAESAVWLCYLRTFTDIPYAQQIATEAANLGFIPAFKNMPEEDLNLAPRFESRFKAITALIKRRKTRSILEIAAGLSSRALILTEDSTIIYVETDLPPTIEAKQQIVEHILGTAGTARTNLKFAAVDILDYSQLVIAAGCTPGPVTVVSEGLIGPLQEIEKFTSAALNIHRLLLASGGVWISSEWGTRADRVRSYGSSLHTVPEQMKLGENYPFENEESISAFLAHTGFHLELVSENDLAGELESINKLDLDREEIRRRLYGRNVYLLSPR